MSTEMLPNWRHPWPTGVPSRTLNNNNKISTQGCQCVAVLLDYDLLSF
jgi:hypothetical protein